VILEKPDDAKLYFERDMDRAEVFLIGSGTAAVFTRRSPQKQTPNEDAAALIPFDSDTCVLVVADGVGGVRGGQHASRLAVEALWSELAQAARSGTAIRTAILDAIEAANDAVVGLAVGAATTLSAVEIHADSVRAYHVGDSMVLVVGGQGRLKLQTISHSPVGFAVEAGVLDEAEAMFHEDRYLVSNVLGTPNMRIDVGSALGLAQRDTVVLASDGLSDNLHSEEIIELVRKGPIEKAAASLAEDAQRRMLQTTENLPSKPDDLTLVIYRGKRGKRETGSSPHHS